MAVPPTKTQRTCSQCGNNGHNARTCTELSSCLASKNTTMTTTTTTSYTNNTTTQTTPQHGFMLFGVRLTATTDGCSSSSSPTLSNSPTSIFRKSMSMNNLSQYEQQAQLPLDHSCSNNNNNFVNDNVCPTGYASDDALHVSASRSRERKRGTPWTEEEHRLFLMGLNKVGKGDWRGISRNFVKTRTPTQVASHAQKYFLRRNNITRRRRRSSLFDITTDAVKHSLIDNQLLGQDSKSQLKTSATFATPYPPTLRPISTNYNRSIPLLPVPPSSKMASLNLNQSPTMSSTSNYSTSTKERECEPFLALKLSHEPSDEESSRQSPTFGGFKGNGDNIISVA